MGKNYKQFSGKAAEKPLSEPKNSVPDTCTHLLFLRALPCEGREVRFATRALRRPRCCATHFFQDKSPAQWRSHFCLKYFCHISAIRMVARVGNIPLLQYFFVKETSKLPRFMASLARISIPEKISLRMDGE